ncbi:DNA-binding transcriptional LysR family regulator [Paraburkholderia sp. GAS41]|uniref:LysR family transcriptional regulator n=1 Tax=Paraburkholderia sp. GAS41 TaxID=3035134 RepID=UPI003D225F22
MDRLAAMETFTAVVEAGSFSAAARRLQIGQPAVSKSIAQLEEHLNARLLLRSTRGLTPTDAGQRFYEHACLAIEEADRAEHSVRESSEGLVGRLRVGAAVTFARLHVIPALGAFLEQHPDLDVEIVMDDRPIDLLEEGVDVALRMGRLDDSAMTARRVASGKRMVVGTKAYFARHGVPRSPAELSQHRAIVHAMRSGGDSWAFGHADGSVQAALTDWTLPGVDVWAVFPSGRMATTKARAFVAFVESLFARPTDSLPSDSGLAD